MPDREKVIKGLELCTHDISLSNNVHKDDYCKSCPYYDSNYSYCFNQQNLMKDALALLKEQEKEIKSLRLLVEWAEECDFGYDQFPDEYERYKDEIKDMKYIDGMVHVAKRTLEDQGAFEEG